MAVWACFPGFGYRCWQVQPHLAKQWDSYEEALAGKAGQKNLAKSSLQ